MFLLLAQIFVRRVETEVMFRDAKSVCENERAAPAGIEANTRFLQVLEPLRSRLEIIFLLELLERRIVEQPHSLIAKRAIAQAGKQHEKDRGKKFSHPPA